MTAIAALVDHGKIWMGGDSAATCSDTHRLVIRKDEKVFIRGNFIFGFTSSFRMGNLLRYSFYPPEQGKDVSDIEYMNTSFVNTIRDCFRAGGYMRTDEGSDRGGVFLVGYRGNVYEIQSDFQVGVPADSFMACGCGIDLCLGSLYSTTDLPPRERIKKALEAAERFNGAVRKPFVIKSL